MGHSEAPPNYRGTAQQDPVSGQQKVVNMPEVPTASPMTMTTLVSTVTLSISMSL